MSFGAQTIAALQRGLSNLLARAVLSHARQNKLQALQVEVLAGEVKDDVELFEPYGLTGFALPGAESVVAFIGGYRGHGIALVQADRRYRPTDLQPGEVAVFNHEGTRVVLRNGGRVEVQSATEVRITTGKVRIEASELEVQAITRFTGQVWANGKRIDETHKHNLVSGGKTEGVA